MATQISNPGMGPVLWDLGFVQLGDPILKEQKQKRNPPIQNGIDRLCLLNEKINQQIPDFKKLTNLTNITKFRKITLHLFN